MNDWTTHSIALERHNKAFQSILTDYPSAQRIDPATALLVRHEWDCMVECINQMDAWLADKLEA